MANFNNFNDIKIYIDNSISSAQLPDKIKGTVMYSAPFSPTSYTKSITPTSGQIWFNTSNNVYYEYNGSSWDTAGNIVPELGDFLHVENYIETVSLSLDLAYPVKVLWSETLGSGVFEWKIIIDKFFSPDDVTINLNSSGKLQLATNLLRNLNSLSNSLSGHSEGVMLLSGSSDSISVVPSSDFLFSKGLQTLYSPDSGSGEVNTLDVKTLSGGSFKIGKDLSGTDPYFALDVETGVYSSPVRKFKLRTDQANNEVVWEQPQQDSVLRQSIGNGVALITSGSSMYPSTNLGRNLGLSTNKFGVVYTGKLNNGQDLIIPSLAGTLARTQDIPSKLQNPTSLIIKLNSGTSEGTNLFTYDGSVSKTINITPASIGSSDANHTHSQYLLKAGDFMTGDIYHNSKTRSVYSSGTGESNKQGEIKSTSTSLVVLAVSNLDLGAGTNKVVLRTGTPNDIDSTGSLVPTLDIGTNLGSPIARWRKVFTDNLDANTDITVGGNSVATQTWVNSQLVSKLNAVSKGETASKTLSFGGTFKVLQTKADGTVEERLMTMPANPDTNSNNYLTGVSGSGNGTVTFTRSGGLGNLTWNASHTHSYLPLSGGTLTGPLTMTNSGDPIYVNRIGGRGTEIYIGAGESLSHISGTDEVVYIAGEGGVRVYASSDNLTSGLNRSAILIDTAGNASWGSGTITAGTFSGNATSATKLATARNIALTGVVTGNANFDGSGNISISTTHTADPTITLTGAVTGSGTMTNLGNVTITTAVTNADKVDNYHASQLWRSDGGTWNPKANIELNQLANNDEWSFDITRNGFSGGYWQVWDSEKHTLLKVEAENGKVTAPYLLYEGSQRVYSPNNKPSMSTLGGRTSTEITTEINAAINALIGGAPDALNTLDELAAALNDNEDYAVTITNALALKAPLASPALTGSPTINGSSIALTSQIPTNNSQLANGAGYLTSHQDISGKADKINPMFSGDIYLNGDILSDGGTINFVDIGALVLNGAAINDLPLPLTGDQAANKNYVDNKMNAHEGANNPHGITPSLIGAQPAGTYNTVIGTDSDINTSGATIIDRIYVTDGVITSMGTRTLSPADIGAATEDYVDEYRTVTLLPYYAVSGGSVTSSYNRLYKTKMSNNNYLYVYTGRVSVSSAAGTATITLPTAITDGSLQLTLSGTNSSGSGADSVYGYISSSSDSTFTITHDYSTTTVTRTVFFTLRGYAGT